MKLARLIDILPLHAQRGNRDVEVTGIASDSRRVRAGDLFVALRGGRHDGHDFLADAAKRGARAFLVDADLPPGRLPEEAATLVVPDTRRLLPRLAEAFYGTPSREIALIGITGTNGKTTVSYLVEAILSAAGLSTGVIGTIEYRIGRERWPAPLTTPDLLEFHRLLRTFADRGARAAVAEVSSHALALGRIAGLSFSTAVFTNLTRDHLDFHGTLEAYFEAKARLFSPEYLRATPPFAVVHLDDPHAGRLIERLPPYVKRITYGSCRGADVTAEGVECTPEGFSARFTTPRGTIPVRGHLIGAHNVANALAAVAVAIAHDVPLAAVAEGIASLSGVPGRLEAVRLPGQRTPLVLVDYAHTPDALENVLRAIAPFRRPIVTLFGCGGDRDRGKRPLMGAAALRGSDFVVVTSDNPRSEEPEEIIEEIRAGLDALGASATPPDALRRGGYTVIPDRRAAIERAIALAGPDDIVLIAGKGHEDYQIVGGRRLPFDDREEARRALRQWREASV